MPSSGKLVLVQGMGVIKNFRKYPNQAWAQKKKPETAQSREIWARSRSTYQEGAEKFFLPVSSRSILFDAGAETHHAPGGVPGLDRFCPSRILEKKLKCENFWYLLIKLISRIFYRAEYESASIDRWEPGTINHSQGALKKEKHTINSHV